MAQDAAIRVAGLTKRFGERTAFEELTFEVDRGEIFGFLGPNGAGKTTTVRVLGTLLAPTAGSAEVAGIPVLPESAEQVRSRVGILPENPGLYLKLSVRENLQYFAGLYGWDANESKRRISAALDAVGLADRQDDLAGALSKGLRQRAALARTLLNEPVVLFLDEPTQGLDPAAARDVRMLVADLPARGVTVFLTTHRLDEAERLCSRVAFLKTRIRSVGRPDELRSRLFATSLEVVVASPPPDPSRFFAAIPGLVSWRGDDGRYVLDVEDPRTASPSVARALVAADVDILRIAEVRHSLEDVYLEVLGDEPEDQS